MSKMLFDLHVRVKAKELAKEIYVLTKNKHFDQDWWLRDQLRRAVISISSNIAEWYYRSSKNEFSRFLKIAKWSCGELISQVTIIKELWFFEDISKIDTIINELELLSKMIWKLISSLHKE
jgi:four helix bundle protein